MKDNKELYDLCRKYKYFYKKLKDLDNFSKKYHDVDLDPFKLEVINELKLIKMEMIRVILDCFDIRISSIECEHEGIFNPVFNSRLGRYTQGNVSVDCTNSTWLRHLFSLINP